jgi:hypothetical protein
MTELPDRLLRDTLREETSTTPSPTCVDAGALAAWADDTMTRTERAIVETHAAGCARCLALLAAMARTEPPPIAPPWWRRSPIGWLLPLAAATAGLVVVVRLAVLEQRSTASLPDAVPAAAAPPSVNLPQVVRAPAQPPETSAGSRASSPLRRHKPQPVASVAGRAALAAPEPSAADTPTAKPAAAPPPPAPPPAAATPAPPAATPAAAPSARAAATVAGGGQLAGGRGGGAGGGRAFAAQDAMKTTAQAAAPAPIVIASPDPDSRWRIVGGTVEHTADGGATWQPQSIAVATPIRAGGAPAARVCWVVGGAGVVLRTTDGTTWTRIPFPEPSDLVAIQASDASHVVVTTADGRRFTTNDAGATWVRQ